MNRVTHLLVAAALLAPATGHAQTGATVELGTGIGASILADGGTVTAVGAPGAGILGQAPLYASVILPSGLTFQPELSLSLLSGGGETLTTLGLGAQVGQMFSGAARNSAYAAVSGALQHASVAGASDTEFALGGRVGYRILVNPGFATSLEAGYRRWLDSDLNEITIAMRLGGVLTAAR
jgi:hypothetical protein